MSKKRKWKRIRQRLRRAAEKAARTGDIKDLRTYMEYRREQE